MRFEVRFGDGRKETGTHEEALALVAAWLDEPVDTKPNFTHPCDVCVFLGAVGDVADLYFCRKMSLVPTVIARFGDNGPEYISGLALGKENPFLADAVGRAQDRGLLPRVVEHGIELYGRGLKIATIRPATWAS